MNVERSEILDKTATFDCKRCGGEIIHEAGATRLVCGHCDYEQNIVQDSRNVLIAEHDLTAALGHGGNDIPVGVIHCEECGANLRFAQLEVTTRCEFCGSHHVLLEEHFRRYRHPESILPMMIKEEQARHAFQKWKKGLWFRPRSLKAANPHAIRGMYLPFWSFDSDVDSSWAAESGTYYWETQYYTAFENGRSVRRSRQVRKTRWRPASGQRNDVFDDLLVCASMGVARAADRDLFEYNLSSLEPFAEEYLAGWGAEEYAMDLNQGWSEGISRIESIQRFRCARDIPGDTYRYLRVRNALSHKRYKLTLLPIWMFTYRHREKPYHFLMNGQSGVCDGEAPLSGWKIAGFIFMLLLLGLGIFLGVGYLQAG